MVDPSATQVPVALVTGGARRIGRAICQTLHQAGFNVLIHYNRSKTEAESLADGLNAKRPNSARLLQGDLNQLSEIEKIAEQAPLAWGRLDALVNNASNYYPTPIGSTREVDWDDLINSNVKAPFFLTQALVPALEASCGRVINITDIHAQNPLPKHTVYCLAKAANTMLTRSLALELAPTIRVNGIAPGAMLWPENREKEEVPKPDKLRRIPLGNLGGADAVARAALFLLADAPYITGEIITVDGGRSLHQY